MSTHTTKRSGWITFAGMVALVVGGYNVLSGIAALAGDDTLEALSKDVLFGVDLTFWGAIWLIGGIAQIIAGAMILQRNPAGLWLGTLIALGSATLTVFVIFIYPLWAIAVLTLDFLVVYALVTRSDEF